MAFYPVPQQAILYGGQGVSPLTGAVTTFTDTWEAYCGQWVHFTPAHNPGPREFHGMTTGPSGFTVVLFGGNDLPFPRLVASPFPHGRDHNETWTWGKRAACLPPDGSELRVGSKVDCRFDPADGVRFDGWSTIGFAPPSKDQLDRIFHTAAPGRTSITADWVDAEGAHSERFNYTIVRRKD
jgi:hypothetical protein